MRSLTTSLMPTSLRGPRLLLAAIVLTMLLVACAHSSSSAPPTTPATGATSPTVSAPGSPSGSATSPSPIAPQSPVPAENNPPGDIPDNTVFVSYRSGAGHFLIKVPEGWARATGSASAKFVSNLNSIIASWTAASAAPTVASVIATDVPQLQSTELAFHLQSVKAVSLAGGRAIETVFQANSKPNAVTGKQYRLVIERFDLFKSGREAILSLSSAVGSDNVDPWRIVSESFRWT